MYEGEPILLLLRSDISVEESVTMEMCTPALDLTDNARRSGDPMVLSIAPLPMTDLKAAAGGSLRGFGL